MQLKISPETRRRILALSRPSTGRFAWAAALDWLGIAAAITLASLYPSVWSYGFSVFWIASRQHGLMILSHDGAHFRAHRNHWINDLLSDFLCAYPIFFDTAIYRHTHLQHHEHLNSDKDPDWTRKITHKDWRFPKSLGQMMRFWTVYLFGQGFKEWIFAASYFSGFGKMSRHLINGARISRKLGFWLMIAGTLTIFGQWSHFFMFWIVPFFLVFPAIQRLRSIAEHFGVSYDGDLQSSRDIAPNLLERYFLAPHGVHMHLSHHLFPAVPFYNLGQLHHLLLEVPDFRERAQINSSYLWFGANPLLKDLRTTKPKIHLAPEAAPKELSKAA